MDDQYTEVINKFLDQSYPGDETLTDLQVAVGMMSTQLDHAENKLEIIMATVAVGIEDYEKTSETAELVGGIGIFIPE